MEALAILVRLHPLRQAVHIRLWTAAARGTIERGLDFQEEGKSEKWEMASCKSRTDIEDEGIY